jgi:hypothetical protein
VPPLSLTASLIMVLQRVPRSLTIALVLTLVGTERVPAQQPARRTTTGPTLSMVVLIAVDQLRPDYLRKYASQFTGGFQRINTEATLYLQGQQAHAITETAPGHSTMLSGREPAGTGIVTNARGVQDPRWPLLGDSAAPGASPVRFLGTTLYDWMLARDPDTRVLSVSRKDRGAILPIGRAKAPVFWYSGGRFTTSRYYADSLPAWVEAFNGRGGPAHLAGTVWTPLLPDSAYAEPDSEPWENGGREVAFPHPLPADPKAAAAALVGSPWMDSLTLSFALEGVQQLQLGRRSGADLLSISLSTTDAVGHAFGPDSKEMHDHLLRLDRWLGQFLDSLATLVPPARTLLVLTADHGVQSFPEYARAAGRMDARRVSLDTLARRANDALRRRYHVDFGLEFDSGLLSADVPALHARGVNLDSLAQALAHLAGQEPGVSKAYTPRQLRTAPATDREANLWRRQLPPDFGFLLCASLIPGSIWSPAGNLQATHGSTAPADVRVPIAFLGAGIRPRVVTHPVRTVDIAPTLARRLGIKPTEPVAGQVLPEIAK